MGHGNGCDRMAVLLEILKWILIVLGILLGVLVILVLSAVFVPVRYKWEMDSRGDGLRYGFCFHWLFYFLTVRKKMEGDFVVLRLCGIPLWRLGGKKTGKESAEEESPGKGKAGEESSGKESAEKRDREEKEPERGKDPEVRKKSEGKKKNLGKKRREKKRFSFDKLSSIMDFVRDSGNRTLIRKIRGEAVKVFRHLSPRKIQGYLRVGTGDPCTTGLLIGGMSLLPVVYQEDFSISPDFEEKVLEGSLRMTGRVQVLFLLRLLLRLYRDRDVKRIFHMGTGKKKKEAA